MSSARALDKRLGDLESKASSGRLDRGKHQRRAEAAAEARAFLEEFDLRRDGHVHRDVDRELLRLYREIDYYTWRNQWGGLDRRFVGRRHEPDGPIGEVWRLTYETEGLRLPHDRGRLEEISDRLKELYAAADARVDAALVTLEGR
jgi:hypothetical protein